jgi:hypothetical protein
MSAGASTCLFYISLQKRQFRRNEWLETNWASASNVGQTGVIRLTWQPDFQIFFWLAQEKTAWDRNDILPLSDVNILKIRQKRVHFVLSSSILTGRCSRTKCRRSIKSDLMIGCMAGFEVGKSAMA